MQKFEDPRLLAHKRAVDAERKAQAILRKRHERVAPFALIANAPRKAEVVPITEFADVVVTTVTRKAA